MVELWSRMKLGRGQKRGAIYRTLTTPLSLHIAPSLGVGIIFREALASGLSFVKLHAATSRIFA